MVKAGNDPTLKAAGEFGVVGVFENKAGGLEVSLNEDFRFVVVAPDYIAFESMLIAWRGCLDVVGRVERSV